MDAVYGLIAIVYDSGSTPQAVQNAQAQIQALQKSPDGWELGRRLLATPQNPHAQFLGALTFTVRINIGLAPDSMAPARSELLACVITAVQQGYAPFVLRKVLSTISTLFHRSPGLENWPDVIQQIVQNVGPELGPEFLTMLVEDAPGLKSQLLPALEPVVPLVLAATGSTEKSLDMFGVWATAYFDHMVPALGQVMALLQHSDHAAAVLRDLLETQQWPREAKVQLINNMKSVITTDFDVQDSPELARLVLVVCSQDFTTNTELHSWIASALVNPALRIVDDPIADEVLEFWTEFVEDAPESLPTGLLGEVVSRYWERVKLYDGVNAEWTEFATFRNYFHDFLETAFDALGGPSLLDHLSRVIQTNLALPDPNWLEIECALDCVGGLEDVLTKFGQHAAIMASPELWVGLGQCGYRRVRQTAARAVGALRPVLVMGPPAGMASALNYLFECLEQPSLQIAASWGIHRLVDGSQAELAGEAPTFVAAYIRMQPMFSEQTVDTRVLASVASVVNSVGAGPERMRLVSNLVTAVSGVQPDRGSLERLEAVASGLNGPYTPSQLQGAALDSIRQQLLAVVRAVLVSADPDVCEGLCRVFKTGLRERAVDAAGNPFAFPDADVLEFVSTKFWMGPEECRPPLLDLASRVVTLARAEERQLPEGYVPKLVEMAGSSGPDSAVAALNLLTDIATPVPGTILETLALPSLASSDRFALRAAVAFFGGTQAKLLDNEWGPRVIRVLLAQFAGHASRSDVPELAKLLRHIIQAQPRLAGRWLQHEAVDAVATPDLAQQDLRVRSEFVAQIQLLRGSAQTKDVVQRFWLHCRGISDRY